MRLALLFLMLATAAMAYVRGEENPPSYDVRTDNTAIPFLLNQRVVAGLKTSEGLPWILPDADVMGAIHAAESAWSTVPTAQVGFQAIATTTAVADISSSTNVIDFEDTLEAAELLNGALAVTVRPVDYSGRILKTDILFSPKFQFTTNPSELSFTSTPTVVDFQGVLTHELGHALGANHTGVISATMFQAGGATIGQRTLGQDDICFVSETYPAGANGFGRIAGTLTDANGNPLHGGLITASEVHNGTVVGGFSSLRDGTFSFILPPGTYQVWAEPLTGEVQPANLYIPASTPPDVDFQIATAAAPLSVAAGATSNVALSAALGASPIRISLTAIFPVNQNEFYLESGPATAVSGTSYLFAFKATGLGAGLTQADLNFVGPVQLHPGAVSQISSDSSVFYTQLDVPAVASIETASLLINYQGNTAAFSGGILVLPPSPSFPANGVANAFSYNASAVAPGEIVAIFGSFLGPSTGVPTAGFDATGYLPTSLGGVQALFDGQPAPLFFVSAGQVNVEVPYEVAGKSSTSITIVNGGFTSEQVSVPVAQSVPGLYASAFNPDGSPNSAPNPAAGGSYLVLYAVGLGALNGSAGTGQNVAIAVPTAAPVSVLLNGQIGQPLYAGATPGLTGLDQVNVSIPTGAASGQQSISISINGQWSQVIPIWIK